MISFSARNIIVVCTISILLHTFSIGQEKSRHAVGFEASYGSQILFVDVDYGYDVFLLKIPYHYKLKNTGKWQIDIIVKPQFNLASNITNSSEGSNGMEFGFNAGIQLKYLLDDRGSNMFAFLTAGPHYISNAPPRQIDGFIFSDNFGLGYEQILNQQLSVYVHIGIRHLSNASFRQPNGGINTAMFGLGLLKNLN